MELWNSYSEVLEFTRVPSGTCGKATFLAPFINIKVSEHRWQLHFNPV